MEGPPLSDERASDEHAPGDAAGRLPGWLARIQRARRLPRRARGVVLLVATVATAVAAVIAAQRLELTLDELVWWPLVVAAVVVTPLTIALNAAELKAMATAVAEHPRTLSWPVATRTVVLATAANLLPVPAGAAIRVQVLRRAGSTIPRAAGITLVAAGVWVGVSLLFAGSAALGRDPIVGVLGIAMGLTATLVSLAGVAALAGRRWRRGSGELTVVEVATALLHAVRLWLVLLGLGVTADLGQALIIGTASPLAAAAGFFPGGIGLAELLGALLAPIAGLAAAAALLAVAVGRVLGLAFTMPIALALGVTDLTKPEPDVDELTGLDPEAR